MASLMDVPMLQFSSELVAINKIVAASSPGGQCLQYRGKITDLNKENSWLLTCGKEVILTLVGFLN